MCLRTALISWMLAPQASSSRVVACFSSSVMGGGGQRAAAPTRRRRSGRDQIVRAGVGARFAAMRRAPSTPRSSGTGWPHSFSSMRRSFAPWPSLTLIRPPLNRGAEQPLDGPGHWRAGLARADHVDVAERSGGSAGAPAIRAPSIDRQVTEHGFGWVGRVQRGAKDAERVAAQVRKTWHARKWGASRSGRDDRRPDRRCRLRCGSRLGCTGRGGRR